MRIFTGYYALIKSYVEANIYPVAISRYIPKSLSHIGLEHYVKLAPSDNLLWKLKEHLVDEDRYERIFREGTLKGLNPFEVQEDLASISKGNHVILLCYEAPDKFCHRHIVADWFKENGIPVGEF